MKLNRNNIVFTDKTGIKIANKFLWSDKFDRKFLVNMILRAYYQKKWNDVTISNKYHIKLSDLRKLKNNNYTPSMFLSEAAKEDFTIISWKLLELPIRFESKRWLIRLISLPNFITQDFKISGIQIYIYKKYKFVDKGNRLYKAFNNLAKQQYIEVTNNKLVFNFSSEIIKLSDYLKRAK